MDLNVQKQIRSSFLYLETNCVVGEEDSIDGTTNGPKNPNDGKGVQ